MSQNSMSGEGTISFVFPGQHSNQLPRHEGGMYGIPIQGGLQFVQFVSFMDRVVEAVITLPHVPEGHVCPVSLGPFFGFIAEAVRSDRLIESFTSPIAAANAVKLPLTFESGNRVMASYRITGYPTPTITPAELQIVEAVRGGDDNFIEIPWDMNAEGIVRLLIQKRRR